MLICKKANFWSVVSLVLLVAAVGCSKGPPKGIISGMVTLDGQPVKNGAIQFLPIDGNTSNAGGKISDGKYTVEAPVNKFNVSISAPEDSQSGDAGPIDDNAPLAKDLIPIKYNLRTELVLDVQEGENQKDFLLTSQ